MDQRYQSKARAKLPEEDVFVTVSLRMSRAMRDDMEAQAKWKGVSRSEYMRELLDAGMAQTALEMAREAHAERLRAPQRAYVPPRGSADRGTDDSGPQNGPRGFRGPISSPVPSAERRQAGTPALRTRRPGC